MAFSVVIPTKNIDNLIPCCEAIFRHEPQLLRDKVIVVDDGLDVGARIKLVDVTVLKGEKPFIFARNSNLGICEAGRDDVVLANDDTTLETPNGFTALEKVAHNHPDFGIISAVTNSAGNPAQFRKGVGLRTEGRIVAFVCIYIPRRTINKIGLLDERFYSYGWDDNDYCRRVLNAGLKIGIYDFCFVDHLRLKSSFRGDPEAAGEIETGRRIFIEKWGHA
ncbi:MAG: glycosyltransferase family 2 protein [Planctomycetota bacterium]|jgi:GT2 family glycosyltransferase